MGSVLFFGTLLNALLSSFFSIFLQTKGVSEESERQVLALFPRLSNVND
jgi:hypothetical protein